jgi:hypothetical protein
MKSAKKTLGERSSHIVTSDLCKVAEQRGDVIGWEQSNRAYNMTHGVSGIDWEHYKHPLPEHVRELIIMYDALKYTEESLKNDIANKELTWSERDVRFKRDYGNLKIQLRADTYKNAKSTPVIFLRVKDAESINNVYFTFSSFENELEVWDISPKSAVELLAQAEQLRTVCEAFLQIIKRVLKTLDKKMLLKAADSVGSSKEYWEKLLQEPPSEAQQPKKVEEPAEKKNGEPEPAEEPAEEEPAGALDHG